jgi:hypothetical protein
MPTKVAKVAIRFARVPKNVDQNHDKYRLNRDCQDSGNDDEVAMIFSGVMDWNLNRRNCRMHFRHFLSCRGLRALLNHGNGITRRTPRPGNEHSRDSAGRLILRLAAGGGRKREVYEKQPNHANPEVRQNCD